MPKNEANIGHSVKQKIRKEFIPKCNLHKLNLKKISRRH